MRAPPALAREHAASRRRAPLPATHAADGVVTVGIAVLPRASVPPLPAATIDRPRLTAALDERRDGAVTLVAAPPGWGKSVLLGSWAAAHGAAWLTVGARHCDARRFWTDVVAALRQADVPLGDLGSPAGALDEEFALRLVDALASAPARPTLVLDDLEMVRGPGLAALAQLVVHGGAALHVAAATRSDPALPLERLRLAGRLGEVRAADLAFTADEASALLAGLGLELREDQVARLRERTEGWAAGLRLAGLSLLAEPDAESFIAAFAGDDCAVADYLTGEVLTGLPAATRELLLRTSIVERMCGGLADALTGEPGGSLVLEQLERDGMFVVPLDRQRAWYRYHGLFAELLRARLRVERPGLEPELHARAAEWLATAGLGREAVAHALAANAPRGAPALLAEHWLELLLDGQDPQGVIAAADRPHSDARLAVAAASAFLTLGDPAGAEARLDAVPRDDGDAARLAALLRGRARGDLPGARAAAEPLLHDGGAGPTGDAQRALALFHLGTAEFAGGRLEAAAERLAGAAAIAVDVGREWLLLGCLGRGAALELADGGLRRAARDAQAALALAEPRGWHRTAPAAWAYASLAATHWHRDELDDAERRTDAAAAAAYASREEAAVLAARTLRAHLAAAHGDLDRARGLLGAVHAALPGAGPMAARWLEAIGPAPWAPWAPAGAAESVAEAHSRLAQGDPLAALRRIAHVPEELSLHPVLRLHACLLDALARHGLGQLDEASRSLERALALAAGEGYRRPFVGTLPTRRLLERQLGRPTAYAPLVAELLDALASEGGAPPGLLDPLSDRERAVLRLLPTLLSYPEIAGELFVSVNTVKTHVKTIYRKLDTTSRRDAVARARELRLI
jgi:LuxR family transcriptional regulator, maltose regulon positive regulatory protein